MAFDVWPKAMSDMGNKARVYVWDFVMDNRSFIWAAVENNGQEGGR